MSVALLQIGDNYVGTPYELRGCLNDIDNFSRFSKDNLKLDYAYHRVLTNEECTYAAWREEIDKLMAFQADLKIIQESGHGTRIKDKDGDEADGFDEAYVPYDFETAGVIPDDYLALQYAKLRPNERLIVLADSCFSGTSQRSLLHKATSLFGNTIGRSLRGAFHVDSPRSLPMMTYDPHARGFGTWLASWLEFLKKKKQQAPLYDSSKVMLLACSQASETSADAWVAEEKKWEGAGTYYILRAARELGAKASYANVRDRANLYLQTNGYSQRVQFEGTSAWLNLPFFN